jgi:DedD protein
MNTIFEREDREDRQERQNSEVTLSTGTLLAIFFGLVVVCGVFFGFGYSMGRHSSDAKAAAAQAAATPETEEATATPSRPKPSALEVMPPPAQQASAPGDDSAPRTVVVDQTGQAASSDSPVKAPPVKTAAASIPQGDPASALKPAPKLVASVPPASAPRSSLAPPAQPAKPAAKAAAPTATMVQIAAISHPEDADALVAALKKRGYTVTVRNEPQDKFLHVQVGPFANHADAVAMRQKLLSDGYNAINK